MPAAIGAGLLAVLQLVNGIFFAGVSARDVAQVLAVTALPSAAWCVYFATLHRNAAILALVFGVLPRALYSVATLSAVPALLAICWGSFLIVVIAGKGLRWLPTLALPLLLLTVVQSLGDILTILRSLSELVGGSLALFWRYNPLLTIWRQLITPGILLLYWVSQMRFLLAVRDE